MFTCRKFSSLSVLILFALFFHKSESSVDLSVYKRSTQDAAIYPGLKKTGLKLLYSDLGGFDDLVEATKQEGFLKIGLFCVIRGAFILYRKPNFNIENNEDFKIASGEDRCFTPTGIESAQPIGPLALPKRNSITFFTDKNFASVAYPTALAVERSFFASMKASVKSLIIIGKIKWTLVTAMGEKYCVRPTDYDTQENNPICMLSDLSATKIKQPGINIVRVLQGCDNSINSTIDVNFCTYWGAVPEVDGDGSRTIVEDDGLAGRAMGDDKCNDRILNDTLYYFKTLITGTFDKRVVLDFNAGTNLKWKLEILDLIWDIAKMATPVDLVSDTYMNKIREFFISELNIAWRNDQSLPGNSGGNDELLVGLLTEYDYRGMLYQTNKCLGSMSQSHAETNWATWMSISDPTKTDDRINAALKRKSPQKINIVLEMAWLILNMVGGICHKLFGYAHNYWALYIHFVNNMYLKPLANAQIWQNNATVGDMNIILGGDMNIQYNKLATFASIALGESSGLEPFMRPLKG